MGRLSCKSYFYKKAARSVTGPFNQNQTKNEREGTAKNERVLDSILDSSTVTMVTGHAGAPPPHLGVPRRLRQDQRDLAALAAQVPSPLASC